MTQSIDLFLNTFELSDPPFLDTIELERFRKIKKQFEQIKVFILPAVNVSNSTELPIRLYDNLCVMVEDFNEIYQKTLSFSLNNQTLNGIEEYKSVINRAKIYCDSFFELSSNSKNLFTINSINNYVGLSVQEHLTKLITAQESIRSLEEKSKTLYTELEEKATKSVISDYAQVFSKQETDYQEASNTWLKYAMVLSAGFIILLICSIIFKWFNSITTLTSINGVDTSSMQVFNYPLLISKILVVSFLIFVITFCFKQYSVYKNLEIVNQQRKNAINSYKLFDASLSDNDLSSKNALMMQLAKSIYEMTHTGFLNNAKSESSNQILEFTKFISNPNSH